MKREYRFGAFGRSMAADCRRSSRKYLRLVERSIDVAREILKGAEIGKREDRKIVAAALLGRLIHAAEAAALLAVRGLQHDAATAIRSCFEILVHLSGCTRSDEHYLHYLHSDLHRQRRLLAGALKLSDLQPGEEQRFKHLLEDVRNQIQSTGAKPVRLEQICENLGLSDSYNSVFRLTSAAAHCSPRILDDLLVPGEGGIQELDFTPDFRNVNIHLFTSADYLLLGSAGFAQFVEVDRSAKWNHVRRDLDKLHPKWVVNEYSA